MVLRGTSERYSKYCSKVGKLIKYVYMYLARYTYGSTREGSHCVHIRTWYVLVMNSCVCTKFSVHTQLYTYVHTAVDLSRKRLFEPAQNGSKRLFLCEKRLSNAQARGICEANAG